MRKLWSGAMWTRAAVDVAAWSVLVAVLVAWLPVTVYSCTPAETARRAECRVESTVAGLVTRSTLTVRGIARANATEDGDGIRFLDGNRRVLYVRDGTGVIGTGMGTLATGVQGIADWSNTPIVARQWPLPGLVIALVALGVLALRILWLRDTTPVKEDASPSRGRPGLALLFLGAGLALLALGPATTYSCRKAESGGATCTIERRIAGLVTIERKVFDNVARAAGGGRIETYRSDESRFKKRARDPDVRLSFDENLGNIELFDAQRKSLYSAEYRGAYGMDTSAIADRIAIMANAKTARPFTFWHVPFLAIVPATLLLLVGTLLAATVIAARVPRVASWAHRAAFFTFAGVAAFGWTLALLGTFPT